MSDTHHTPLPWEQSTVCPSMVYGPPTNDQYDDDASFVADCLLQHDGSLTEIANAEFICLACNCHDDLLTACRWIILMDDDGLIEGGPTTNRGLKAVHAAVAKAETVQP